MAGKSPKRRKSVPSPAAEPSSPSRPVDYFTHTDEGNVDRFLVAYGDRIRYDETRDKWYTWKEHWWSEAGYSVIYQAASKLIRKLHEQARERQHAVLEAWLYKCLSGGHIREMINRARNIPPICVRESGVWNRDPMLFAVRNGVIDLRSGQIRKGAKADMINRHSPVVFDATAEASLFPVSLREIFCQREDLIEYVLTAFGYALTGLTSERSMFILYGQGSNGKSKLLELLAFVLGDDETGYAKSIPASSLKSDNRGNPDAPRNDLAAIAESRLVVASESDLKQGVAESMVKWLTGGDMISARFNHGRPFQYRPTYKIFLSCNNRPVVRGTDNAIWNRLPLIPFDATFSGASDDTSLIDKWKAEAPGILNLFIDYCLRWQERRLKRPECVTLASKEYRTESNPVAPFLDSCCDYDLEKAHDSDHKEGDEPETLWEAYVVYCHKMREKPDDMKKFKAHMETFGFEQARTSSRRYWRGVVLRKQADFQVVDDGSDR